MAFSGEKRYEEVEFDPPASWSYTTNPDGSRTWTNSGAGAATCKVTKPSGAIQNHVGIPSGKATITCKGGDVTVVIAP